MIWRSVLIYKYVNLEELYPPASWINHGLVCTGNRGEFVAQYYSEVLQ